MKKTTGDLTVELVEENKALKSQLADIKYLNADEVEKILEKMQDDARAERLGYFKRTVSAICKLAIKVDREKIIEIIQKHTHRNMLMHSHQIDEFGPVPRCFVTIEDFENCVDQMIKVLEGK